MTDNVIDEKVKTYLIACLVTGIDVENDPAILMAGLVDYMNSTERMFWAEGDEDGVIIHDKHNDPLVNVLYNGKQMKFTTYGDTEFEAFDKKKNIGFSILNIVGFLGSWNLDFEPSILKSKSYITTPLQTGDITSPEDWAL